MQELCINLKFERLGSLSKIWENMELIRTKWVEQHRLPNKDGIMQRIFQQNQRLSGNSGRPWGCKERREILIVCVVFLIAKLKQFSGGEQ
jgi:hypothetical protein